MTKDPDIARLQVQGDHAEEEIKVLLQKQDEILEKVRFLESNQRYILSVAGIFGKGLWAALVVFIGLLVKEVWDQFYYLLEWVRIR